MIDSVSVRPVQTKTDFDTFLTFPWTLYKGDPYWVPPLLPMQKHKLDRQKNPSWKHMEGEYFVARRGDKPVGTIAAFINHRHNEFQKEHIGFFGCFEVYDDQEAAVALLDTAAEYVRSKGYDAIRGPASFSTNDECGLLVEGFDDPPAIIMPYNYPYYQRLIENTPGFDKAMDIFSYHLSLQGWKSSPKHEQTRRVTLKNNERRHIIVRTINPKQVRQDLQTLKAIYNQAWDNNWGFVPFSDDELEALVNDLGQYLEPRLTFFAEVDGNPVAFLLGVPDMNQPLHRAYARPGKPHLLTLLQVLWHWRIRSKITRIRVPLMGVQEGYRGIGVEAAMFIRLFEETVKSAEAEGWQSADAGWVLETNEPMHRLVTAYSGYVYKRHRFYQRSFS